MIKLEILRKEQILSVLPLMHQWALEAFQKPPYSSALLSNADIVDPQDTIYVNDPEALVVIAKYKAKVVGVAAGIPFDSKYVRSYFETRNKKIYVNMLQLGFNPSQLFYITYILTAPEFENRADLSRSIFDALHAWAAQLNKKYFCWFEDISCIDRHHIPCEKPETWKDDIGGFIEMGLQLNSSWPTYQMDGSIREEEHTMKFFLKGI